MNVLTSPGGVLATYDSSSVDVSVSSSPAQLTARRSGVSSQQAISGVFRRTRSILNNFVRLRPVRFFLFLSYNSGTYSCATVELRHTYFSTFGSYDDRHVFEIFDVMCVFIMDLLYSNSSYVKYFNTNAFETKVQNERCDLADIIDPRGKVQYEQGV